MPCIISEKSVTSLGLANGSRVMLVGICLFPQDTALVSTSDVCASCPLCHIFTNALLRTLFTGRCRRLTCPSNRIGLTISTPPAWTKMSSLFSPSLLPGIHDGSNSVIIKRSQLPLPPCYAWTYWKCQNQHIRYTLWTPPLLLVAVRMLMLSMLGTLEAPVLVLSTLCVACPTVCVPSGINASLDTSVRTTRGYELRP